MDDRTVTRRGALGSALALGVGGLVVPRLVSAANTEEGGYQVIANAFGFGCQIDDCPDASKNIRAVSLDPLRFDLSPVSEGQGQYRLYGPGQAHWGSAKFTSACTLGGSKELQAWWQEAAKGKNIRKAITITLYKRDRSPGRTYTLNECFPTQWSSVNFDTSSTVQTETLTVNVGYIKFST